MTGGEETCENKEPGIPKRETVRNASIGVRLMRYWPLYVMLLPCIVYYALICYVPMAGSVLAFKDYSFKKGIWGSRGLVLIISKRSSRATMQDD